MAGAVKRIEEERSMSAVCYKCKKPIIGEAATDAQGRIHHRKCLLGNSTILPKTNVRESQIWKEL